MLECIDLAKTVSVVRSASASTESTFLQMGQALEASIIILSNLAASFETALTELRNEKLGQALRALSDASARVAELGRGQSAASVTFDHMQRVTEAVNGRIAKMNRSIKDVDSLVINSKIAAANIRASEIDFTTFAGDIARTLKMTKTSLDSFGTELQMVRKQVSAAHAGQIVFEKGQQDAVRTIPHRLNATVSSIPLQQKRNAQAISAVEQRNQHVRQQVCKAIAALQAGDMARQRLEHADYALSLIAQARDSTTPAAFTEQERQAFIITTCRLQTAQISDTADEFERNVHQIAASLNSMATEAGMLRSLAGSTYGSAERGQGTFIGDLEAQIDAALSLFKNYDQARADAASVMISVSDSTKSLCEHLHTVQSLEDDIRIMGLNTTLKCGRIGPEGRALGLIAQELRTYGNEFAREANALVGEVAKLTQITSTIDSGGPNAAALVQAVMEAMKDALSTLRQVGQTLDDTLSALERDSERVVVLLERTATNCMANDEIIKTLRQAADDLGALAPPDEQTLLALGPHAQDMLDTIARAYTMATERVIHERILGRSGNTATTETVGVQAELEDMLF